MRIGIAVVALSVGLGASAASAQPGFYGYGDGYRYGSPYRESYGPRGYYGALPAHRVMAAVREEGLRPVSHPMRNGRHYIVDAVDRRGDLKRVLVDGYGEVVQIASVTRPDYPSARGAPWRGPNVGPRPQAPIPSEPEAIGPDGPGADERDIYEEEPPMRPRARISREPIDERDMPPRNAAIPPPPAPLDRSAVRPAPAKPERKAAKPRTGDGETASVNPAQGPRVRPAEGGETAAPSKPKPPAARTASPRVILPGGPPAKTEAAKTEAAKTDAGATTAASPSLDGEKPPAPAPGAALPPIQPLD